MRRSNWQSNMYDPNDIVADGKRITNLFNTRDEAFHSKYMKPIRGFWSLSKVLESEPYLDETLTKWTNKLAATFVDGPAAGSVCMMDKWMAYGTCSLLTATWPAHKLYCSGMGYRRQLQLWVRLWLRRRSEGCW